MFHHRGFRVLMAVAFLAGILLLVGLPSVIEAQLPSKTGTLQTAQSGNADGIPISTMGYGLVTVDSNDNGWTGVVNYEARYPNAGYVAVRCRLHADGTIVTSLANIAGSVTCNIAGAHFFQARTSGAAGGDVTVTYALLDAYSGVGSVSASIVAGPTPATVDTEFTGQTADFDLEPATVNLRLLGYTVREDAATAAVATVVLRHELIATTCDTGVVFEYIELDPNESRSEWWGSRGKAAASGICADVLAGSVSINIFTIVEASP